MSETRFGFGIDVRARQTNAAASAGAEVTA